MENNESVRVEIIPRDKKQYKAALHTHSRHSDGQLTPLQLKQTYMAEGYSAIAFTDHRSAIPHPELTDGNFVALTGEELDFTVFDEKGNPWETVHINAIASNPEATRSDEKYPLDFDLLNGKIAELKREGYFVTVNHPVWSNMSTESVMAIKGADGMEVFNSIAVEFNNYSDDSSFYECFLRRGGRAIPIAADDTHKVYGDGSPFREYFKAATYLLADELSYDGLMGALKSGCCYASTGPRFYGMWLEGDLLYVECSPVVGVYAHGKCITVKNQDVRKTDCMTLTAINIAKIRESSPYVWVQLRDNDGRKAWSVPYFF